MALNHETKFISFDLETSGPNPKEDLITEIHLLKFTRHDIHTPNPTIQFEESLVFTKAPTALEMQRSIDFFEDRAIVAHFAPFDMAFFNRTCDELKVGRFANSVFDTLRMARAISPGLKNYRLNTIVDALDLQVNYDSWVYKTAVLFNYLMKTKDPDTHQDLGRITDETPYIDS